ncbi:MAG: tRNA epoxyqueuosine(34) reductase QueG [Elusimicrobia bacterium GWA2_69_24]|nr:MAG: tRNA epoxyqueuosine(34) reductase QueG [Elusimicrobia bacterium GWA2_69_24]
MTAALRARARSLGADAVGIAPAAPDPALPGGAAAYREWLARGMHAGMTYMERRPEQRDAVARWFPKARSVALCAFSYSDGKPAATLPGQGRLSRYCLPPDYHDVLRGRMESLLSWLRGAVPGAEGRVFVDTSPVLERLHARLAGIGWVGKNAMLISRRLGSYFFLAGLATDLELDYDPPAAEHCGTCTRCLDACPTRALSAPRVLDASRCIAYFTVEHRKGSIPADLRPAHGDRVFGCDACQEACPWNRFSPPEPALRAERSPGLDLDAAARLSPDAFAAAYRGTPLQRTGHAAFLRNVLLAMGNSGERRFAPILEGFARSADPVLAEQARWSLERLSALC